MPTSYDDFPSVITFQIDQKFKISSTFAPVILTADLQYIWGGGVRGERWKKVTEEYALECRGEKNPDMVIIGHSLVLSACIFHFQVDNTQAKLKYNDISAILFGVHCDFFIISRNRRQLD